MSTPSLAAGRRVPSSCSRVDGQRVGRVQRDAAAPQRWHLRQVPARGVHETQAVIRAGHQRVHEPRDDARQEDAVGQPVWGQRELPQPESVPQPGVRSPEQKRQPLPERAEPRLRRSKGDPHHRKPEMRIIWSSLLQQQKEILFVVSFLSGRLRKYFTGMFEDKIEEAVSSEVLSSSPVSLSPRVTSRGTAVPNIKPCSRQDVTVKGWGFVKFLGGTLIKPHVDVAPHTGHHPSWSHKKVLREKTELMTRSWIAIDVAVFLLLSFQRLLNLHQILRTWFFYFLFKDFFFRFTPRGQSCRLSCIHHTLCPQSRPECWHSRSCFRTEIELFTLRNYPLVPYWIPRWTCEEEEEGERTDRAQQW